MEERKLEIMNSSLLALAQPKQEDQGDTIYYLMVTGDWVSKSKSKTN